MDVVRSTLLVNMDEYEFQAVQRALSEPKRFEILELLRRDGATCSTTCADLQSKVGLSQSTFSHHISRLADANLVGREMEGRFARLWVNESVVAEYLAELQKKLLGSPNAL